MPVIIVVLYLASYPCSLLFRETQLNEVLFQITRRQVLLESSFEEVCRVKGKTLKVLLGPTHTNIPHDTSR